VRGLKIFLALFCVWSTVDFIEAIFGIHVPHTGAYPTSHHGSFGAAASLVTALVCAAALCGIHGRSLLVWKLGWGFLAVEYVLWFAPIHRVDITGDLLANCRSALFSKLSDVHLKWLERNR
jgi:hypothetical protein